jgi:hypothetical protein
VKRAKRNNKRLEVREKNIAKFLDAYERVGCIRDVLWSMGLTHWCHTNWLKRVDGYRERFDAAHARVMEKIGPIAEAEAVNRAIHGERTLVIDKGRPVEVWVNKRGEPQPEPADPEKPGDLQKVLYWETKKSDQMLSLLLRSSNPGRYSDRLSVQGSVKHTHDLTEDVKRIIADRESLELANALARRQAINAGGDGQSSN